MQQAIAVVKRTKDDSVGLLGIMMGLRYAAPRPAQLLTTARNSHVGCMVNATSPTA